MDKRTTGTIWKVHTGRWYGFLRGVHDPSDRWGTGKIFCRKSGVYVRIPDQPWHDTSVKGSHVQRIDEKDQEIWNGRKRKYWLQPSFCVIAMGFFGVQGRQTIETLPQWTQGPVGWSDQPFGYCRDFNHKPDICRYGKAEFPARVLPHEMQMTDFLFWYYRGRSCSLKI